MHTRERHRFDLKSLGLDKLYNWKDEYGKGRICMIISAWITKIVGDMVTFSLYSAFLSANGFSMVEVSLLSVMTLISSFCSILAPLVLERFEKRKWILAGMKLVYYLISLLGMTLIPLITDNRTVILVGACAMVFIAGAINAIVTSGYSAWHINFMQGDARIYHFSCQQITTTIIGSILLFFISAIADRYLGTDNAVAAMFWIRMFGLVLGVVDVCMLLLPNEYPYEREFKQISLSNLIRVPFSSKKFIETTMIYCLWGLGGGFVDSILYYYLQNDVGISMKLLSMNSIIYMIALILLSKSWRLVLRRKSWLTTFGIAGLMHAPSVLLLIFLTPENSMVMYTIVCVIQGVAGVGLNLAFLNIMYVNAPNTDQTYYFSFFNAITNLAPLLSKLFATFFIGWMGTKTIRLLGLDFGAVRWLLLLQFICMAACSILYIVNHDRLLPDSIRH